jgi:multidrug efflux pump subunit AcrB
MNITAAAIKQNRVTYILLAMVIIMGLAGYRDLPRDSMPPFTIRVARVVTSFPGAGPERVESLITQKIEEVAQEIAEVDFIASESRTGLSIVRVNLKETVAAEELQPVWDRLRRKIEAIQGELPDGIYGPEVKDDDVGVVYGIQIGLAADGFEYAEAKEYADDLRQMLIKLQDAAKVEIGGVIEERIFADFDNAELASLGLSVGQLQSTISSANIIIPAGEITYGDERIILEPSGSFEDLDALRKLLVPVDAQGRTVYLGDIANIYRGYISPREEMALINGEEGLSLGISLKDGANIVQLGKDVDVVLADFNKTLPVGISAARLASQDFDVSLQVSDFTSSVLQSVTIVLLVMLVFLGLRTGFVVATLIPSAIILTLLLMQVFKVGLNQVTLAALIMALGMLVDNAIVMAESILVKMEAGRKVFDAAIESSRELMIPLLVSSLTTSAAFLSFYLAQSTMGEIMGPLFVVITMALLSSWLMALTIVPMFAAAFIKLKKRRQGKKEPPLFERWAAYYGKFLGSTLRRPIIPVAIVIGLFVIALIGFRTVPFVFMPDSERNLVTLDMNLPLGTSIETTAEAVKEIESFISKSLLVGEGRNAGVADWSSFIGKGPYSYDLGYVPGEANSGYAHMLINTSSGEDNQLVIDALEEFCFNQIPEADFSIGPLIAGGGAAVPVQVRISGEDPVEMFAIADQVKSKLRAISGTRNIDDDWGQRIKKFYVDIDPARLALAGVTNQDVAVSLYTVLSGTTIGEFREADDTIPIVMREGSGLSLSYEDLETLNVFSQMSGRNVPLAQVASIRPQFQFPKILRRDLDRTVTVESDLKEGFTAKEITDILVPWLEDTSADWKPGYNFEVGGESEKSDKAMSAVIAKLPLASFIILLLLVLQFNSMRRTFIILSTTPLGLIGVATGLMITGTNFSFTGFLGLISLAGIVINNGIVLVDRIDIERARGLGIGEAIVKASSSRFRPILLTTLTTSLGLIPLWIGGGAMWEPMAVGIIFGLLFATVITLLFVPAMYRVLFRGQ